MRRALLIILASCSSPSIDSSTDAGSAADSEITADASDAFDSSTAPCIGEPICTAHDKASTCKNGAWVEEACAKGSGCVLGKCVVGQCSDECAPGEMNCAMWDVVQQKDAPIDAVKSMHDRARAYDGWLRRWGMAAGGVGSPHFSDAPNYKTIDIMHSIGDSALWTGTTLASEALRYAATGSVDARAAIERLALKLHLWLTVTGSPGVLARFVAPAATNFGFAIPDLDCKADRVHCGTMLGGKSYDYVGHVSRDQYQGVVLGLALAYEALADEKLRSVIREDLVTLVEELMKERKVPLRVKVNGTQFPTSMATVRFIVVHDAETVNGALDLRIDTNNTSESDMYGFQEFSPDAADLVHEVPGLGWVPALPRPSSAIMLASFFQVALMVTDKVPAYAQRRAAILAYYSGHQGKGGNANDWLKIASGWTAGTGCGGNYYANNITMMPLYDLVRLETDPGKQMLERQIFTGKLWPAFENTKNSFFSFVYAGSVPGVSAQIPSSAMAQLAQFPVPPRVKHAVDLRASSKYPQKDPNCANQVVHTSAVDVGDRVADGFIWQRDPWELYDPGDEGQTEAGVDYITAYWLARKHGFTTDDAAGRCMIQR